MTLTCPHVLCGHCVCITCDEGGHVRSQLLGTSVLPPSPTGGVRSPNLEFGFGYVMCVGQWEVRKTVLKGAFGVRAILLSCSRLPELTLPPELPQ